eukprot:841581_1
MFFGGFGLLYTGMVHYAVYCKLYPFIFDRMLKATRFGVLGQTAVDQLIHSPLVYFPVFYCVKGMIYEGEVSKRTMHCALNQYFNVNMKDDVFALWKVWVPANILTFTVVPMHLRVPWLAGVSFVWNVILSYSR